MKLGPDVLVEIVNTVRLGLLEQRDISDLLREIDVEQGEACHTVTREDGEPVEVCSEVVLSQEYLRARGRV